MENKEIETIFHELKDEISSNTTSMPPEFQKSVDDGFWDLIDTQDERSKKRELFEEIKSTEEDITALKRELERKEEELRNARKLLDSENATLVGRCFIFSDGFGTIKKVILITDYNPETGIIEGLRISKKCEMLNYGGGVEHFAYPFNCLPRGDWKEVDRDVFVRQYETEMQLIERRFKTEMDKPE